MAKVDIMTKKLLARGQATLTTLQDSYTITQSVGSYIFSADSNGNIPDAVSFTSTVKVSIANTLFSGFAIGSISKPTGFSMITVDQANAAVTFSVAANTPDLADQGSLVIPVIIDGIIYNLPFCWSKSRKGETGADGADANLLDWVKEWNSNKTLINTNTVITPKLFSGLKNADGTLTGVAIGHFTLSTLNSDGLITADTINGLYGFRKGYKTFSIDSSGSVEIGRGNQVIRYDSITGKIEFGSEVTLNWVNAIDAARNDVISIAASDATNKTQTIKIDLESSIADAKKAGMDARNVADAITNKANSEGWATKLTFIGSTGIFTGTLSSNTVHSIQVNASQITAGTINAARIDVASLKSSLITAGNIEALTLNVTHGKIGGWNIDADSIYRGTKNNTNGAFTISSGSVSIGSNGICGYRWRLDATGAGSLAGGNISWNAAGTVTFASSVVLNWTNAANTAAANALNSAKSYADIKKTEAIDAAATDATNKVNAVQIGGRNLFKRTTSITGLVNTPTIQKEESADSVNGFKLTGQQNLTGGVRVNNLITHNGTYVVSYWGKSNGTSTPNINMCDKACTGNAQFTTSWKKFELTFHVTNYSETVYHFLDIENLSWLYYWFKDFKVEEGTKATGWSLAPEDTENSIRTVLDKANEVVTALGGASFPKVTKITSSGIYTGTVEATQIRANSITAGQINVASIQGAVVTAAIVNGLACTFSKGSIGGFTMTSERLYDAGKHVVLQSGNARRIGICKAANAVLAGGTACVMMFYNSDTDWGLYGHDGTSHIFSLGSSNQIAGWKLNVSQICKNNVCLDADGSIVNSTRWKLNNDGSGQLANGAIAWNAAGTVTFSSAVTLNWTNAATNALNSAKAYADIKKTEAVSSAASDATTKADAAKELASAMAFGKMLYRDPTFYKGDNGTNTYNNSQNGKVIITHEADNTAPNDSKHVLVIKNIGPSAPYCGGFYFGTMTSYRKIFITRIIAKIPIGRNISFHSNSMGTEGVQKWLTPVVGTGDWCEYICKVRCGTANFSSTHFFAVTGSVGTTSSPVEWRVAYATVFDVTSTEKYPTTIDGDGIYTASLNASQITTGIISADRIAAGSINSSKLNAGSIRADIINVAYINGLTCNFVRGTIGGFLITADSINTHPVGSLGALPVQIRSGSSGSGYWYNGSYKPKGITLTWHQSENAGHIILGEIAVNGSTVRTGYMGLQMMAWDGVEYFCLSANCTRSGSKEVYNRIAGWAFDSTRIWKNSVSLGNDGSIYNGDKWRLNNDGSGKIANGNISWNTTGAVTFSSSVSLSWKDDIEAAKSTNYGYRYAVTITITGNSSKYYPVVIKGGDQTVKRDILINRSYSEKAPSDWANSTTHMGGLNLQLKTNFGGWGGASYSWNIVELEEVYCRMFAGAVICGNSTMFAIFLRGGGTGGAVYHLYSNQPLTDRPFCESPVSTQAPQICYNSDLIFKTPNGSGGYYLAYAPALRTLTNDVEAEIKAHRYAASTHIDSNGIYTGTLTAGQITAGTISADRIAAGSINAGKLDAASIKSGIINTAYINGLTCTFVRGTIGGWSITSNSITKNNVSLGSDGTISNGSFWLLSRDGSGFLANRNMTWDVNGNVIMTGTINANSGTIGGFTIASGRIGSTASGSGSGGGLAIYNDLFRVGSSSSYVLFGDNTFPATSGGTAATGRIVNNKYNSYNTNYGLYIDVRNGDKNIGIYSNAPCMANAFIGNKVTNIYFTGSSYTWDFSKNNVFFVYANTNYNVNLPVSSSVAYMFGLSSLPSDFGYMFTIIYNYNWSYQLTFMNLRDQNGNMTNVAMAKGDTLTLLCANYPSFHYQVVHRQN